MRDQTNTATKQNGKSLCAGACPNIANEALLSLGPENRFGQIPIIRLFLAKYHAYPSSLCCETDDDDVRFHVTTILNYMNDELNHDINKDCIERQYHRRTKQKYVESRVSDLGNGIMIYFNGSELESEVENPNQLKVDYGDNYYLLVQQIKIYYLPEHDSFAQDLSSRFSKMIVFLSKTCRLEMVCKNDCGYYLSGIKIKKPLITDLALHYGSSFVSIHDKILKNLNEKESKGIVLLHGVPGSGKQKLNSSLSYLLLLLLNRKNSLYSIFNSRSQRQKIDLYSTRYG
jgi:hypothetical protein